MSRTAHHTPWRHRTNVDCAGRDAARETEHRVATLRRRRTGDRVEVELVVTGFAVYSYARAWHHEDEVEERTASHRAARRRSQRHLLAAAATANAALADGSEDWEDVDGWSAPARPLIRW